MVWPIICTSLPPSSAGVTTAPAASVKTSADPIRMPERLSGSVTSKKMRAGPAPSVLAARARWGSCATSDEKSGKHHVGQQDVHQRDHHGDLGVENAAAGARTRPSPTRTLLTVPSAPSSTIQP